MITIYNKILEVLSVPEGQERSNVP